MTTPIVPHCHTEDIGTNDYRSHLFSLSEWVAGNGVHWKVGDTIPGDAGELEAILLESISEGTRVLIWHEERTGDPDLYHVASDPGGIMEIDDPAGTASSSWSGLATRVEGDTSWFNNEFPLNDLGTKWGWMGVEDAFAFFIFTPTEDGMESMLHAGRVFNPSGLLDEQRGIDGHAIWWGDCDREDSGHSVFGFSITALHKISDTEWGFSNCEDRYSGYVLGEVRPSPVAVVGDSDGPISGSPIFGLRRYMVFMPEFENNKTVWPSTDTNQGWMHVTEQGSTGQGCLLWDKTVTP